MLDALAIAADTLDRRGTAPAGGRGVARPLRPRRGMIGTRALAAFAAIFGLYLQLAAAAACLAGSPLDGAAGLAASPICHAQAAPADPADGDPGQPAHGACPFCSLHGHGGLSAAAARAYRPFVPVGTAAEPPAAPTRCAPPRPRVASSATPRGPPILA